MDFSAHFMEHQSPVVQAAPSSTSNIPNHRDRVANESIGGVGSSSVQSSKSKKQNSGVWSDFETFDENGRKKAKCKKRGQTYVCNGTSNLIRHIDKICPFRNPISHMDVTPEEFDQGVFREKVAKAIVRHGYAFKFVEHEGMRDVFSYLNPKVQHLSRNTAKSDIVKIYEIEKQKLKNILDSVRGRICLTSDLWSSLVSNGYMALTAHYVDNNWILQRRLLVFRHVPPPHDGQNIGEKLISFLQEWGIERKIFTLTLDNAGYNNGVIDLLKNHLRLKNSLVSDGEFIHVRCGAHILNLIVQNGLKTIDVSIGKIRESVKYVRGSETRILKFAECIKQLGLRTSKKLVQDMPIRWNSTYSMLDCAILYKHAFQQLEIVDINYKWCPSYDEWVRVEKIAKFLRPFFEMTELFSGSHYPTANLYFPNVCKIQMLIKDEMRSEDSAISAMAKGMKPKFDKYWDSYSTVLSFAVVLDPRYKLQFVEYAYKKLDSLTYFSKIVDLKADMHTLFEDYLLASPSTPTHSSNSVGGDVEMCDDFMEEFDEMQSQRDITRSQSQLDRYLGEPLVDRKQFPDLDVLSYWKQNVKLYPELSCMARDILSIPITTVASESAFSHGGRIIGKFRSSILPKNAEAILCGRDWIEAYDSEDEEVEEELSTDINMLITQLERMSTHNLLG